MSSYILFQTLSDENHVQYGIFDDKSNNLSLISGIDALHMCADRLITNAKVENSVIKILSHKRSRFPVLTKSEIESCDKLFLILPIENNNDIYEIIDTMGNAYIMCKRSICKFIPDDIILNARIINNDLIIDNQTHYTSVLSRSFDAIHSLS